MSLSLSRRRFLRTTLAAAMPGLWATHPARDDESTLMRRLPVGLKLSCSSLAFSDFKWDEALPEIKKLGFRYVDLAMFEGWTHVNPSALSDPEAHGKKIAAACARCEIEPIAIHANFVLGDPNLFPGLTTPDAAARKTILAQFERVVTCARTAEIPLVNVMPGRFVDSLSPDQNLKNACDLLTQMHALAARRGLLLSFENHTGSIGQHPDDAMRILEKVPGLRLDYDTSHVVANQYSLEQTQPLMKYVAHVSVRNAQPGDFNAPLENGALSYSLQPYIDAFRIGTVHAYVSAEYFRPTDRGNLPGLKEILLREGVSAQ